MDWLPLLLLGFVTGAYGVMVGAGGGFILSPALLIFFDLEPQVVAGTALALVAVNSVSGSQAYRRLGLIDYRSALLFAAAAVPGAVLAPFVLANVAGSTFRMLFGLLLIALAVQMVIRTAVPESSRKSRKPNGGAFVRSRKINAVNGDAYQYTFNEAYVSSLNLVLGFISSFFGTGGGFLRTPILVYAFSFPVRIAVATSVLTMAFYTTAGALTHAGLGNVDWYPTFVWAGIGLVGGAQVGARLASRVGGPWILRLLLVVVLALGIKLLIDGVLG